MALDQQKPTIDAAKEAATKDSTSSTHKEAKEAKLIPSTIESLTKAGKRLRDGHLVSFPTETVYGLGCHALDPNAVKKVFEAKERPLSDPLIVHVTDCDSALNLWDASSSFSSSSSSSDMSNNLQKKVLQTLVHHFWPGPLTIVAKASPTVPSIIMANTGFVACRSPSHPIARSLIELSQVPIAAPSANKFGHVSPTKAMHVFDDLGREDVWIVDPSLNIGNENGGKEDGRGDGEDEQIKDVTVCNVGVESTVAKVEFDSEQQEGKQGIITVLRHGAISAQDIFQCLKDSRLDKYVQVQSKQQATDDHVNHVAPGQTIRHYSPNVQSYLISYEKYEQVSSSSTLHDLISEEEIKIVKKSVIIDFGKKLNSLKDIALAYRDISPNGDSDVAASKVFDTLRWSESIEGAERVFFPEVKVDDTSDDALVLAVKDRLTRAASGVVVSTLI